MKWLKSSGKFCIQHIWLLLVFGCEQAPSQSVESPQQAHFQAKADSFLIKDDTLRAQFSIDADGIRIYASSEDKKAQSPETIIYWDEIADWNQYAASLHPDSLFKVYAQKGTRRFSELNLPPAPIIASTFSPTDSLPLRGMRIALDPGHVGGTMEYAKLERKYVSMAAGTFPGKGGPVEFNEGTLTLATAWELRDMLEKAGATVMMTREKPHLNAMDCTWEQWINDSLPKALAYFVQEYELTGPDSAFWYTKANARDLQRAPFNLLDLERRADKINNFHPDLTLIIHYNVEEKNEPDKRGFHHPIQRNFNMAFVPGSYMAGELGSAKWRCEFLVKLLSDEIEKSIQFSDKVVEHLADATQVPALVWDDSLRYLRVASMPTPATGVFSRNLALNRQILGVMSFGESLYQDNVNEAPELARKDYEVHGIRTSPRIKDVARGYYDAILDFAPQLSNK